MVNNGSGLPRYHLRRVGPAATRPECASLICFQTVTTIVGRNRAQADYILCSASHIRNVSISRRHARIIRNTENNAHKVVDDSRNGIFVNDIKITGSVVLAEGDVVTFGHPNGERLSAGARVRQPDSEYQFIFETCSCRIEEQQTSSGSQNVPQTRVVQHTVPQPAASQQQQQQPPHYVPQQPQAQPALLPAYALPQHPAVYQSPGGPPLPQPAVQVYPQVQWTCSTTGPQLQPQQQPQQQEASTTQPLTSISVPATSSPVPQQLQLPAVTLASLVSSASEFKRPFTPPPGVVPKTDVQEEGESMPVQSEVKSEESQRTYSTSLTPPPPPASLFPASSPQTHVSPRSQALQERLRKASLQLGSAVSPQRATVAEERTETNTPGRVMDGAPALLTVSEESGSLQCISSKEKQLQTTETCPEEESLQETKDVSEPSEVSICGDGEAEVVPVLKETEQKATEEVTGFDNTNAKKTLDHEANTKEDHEVSDQISEKLIDDGREQSTQESPENRCAEKSCVKEEGEKMEGTDSGQEIEKSPRENYSENTAVSENVQDETNISTEEMKQSSLEVIATEEVPGEDTEEKMCEDHGIGESSLQESATEEKCETETSPCELNSSPVETAVETTSQEKEGTEPSEELEKEWVEATNDVETEEAESHAEEPPTGHADTALEEPHEQLVMKEDAEEILANQDKEITEGGGIEQLQSEAGVSVPQDGQTRDEDDNTTGDQSQYDITKDAAGEISMEIEGEGPEEEIVNSIDDQEQPSCETAVSSAYVSQASGEAMEDSRATDTENHDPEHITDTLAAPVEASVQCEKEDVIGPEMQETDMRNAGTGDQETSYHVAENQEYPQDQEELSDGAEDQDDGHKHIHPDVEGTSQRTEEHNTTDLMEESEDRSLHLTNDIHESESIKEDAVQVEQPDRSTSEDQVHMSDKECVEVDVDDKDESMCQENVSLAAPDVEDEDEKTVLTKFILPGQQEDEDTKLSDVQETCSTLEQEIEDDLPIADADLEAEEYTEQQPPEDVPTDPDNKESCENLLQERSDKPHESVLDQGESESSKDSDTERDTDNHAPEDLELNVPEEDDSEFPLEEIQQEASSADGGGSDTTQPGLDEETSSLENEVELNKTESDLPDVVVAGDATQTGDSIEEEQNEGSPQSEGRKSPAFESIPASPQETQDKTEPKSQDTDEAASSCEEEQEVESKSFAGEGVEPSHEKRSESSDREEKQDNYFTTNSSDKTELAQCDDETNHQDIAPTAETDKLQRVQDEISETSSYLNNSKAESSLEDPEIPCASLDSTAQQKRPCEESKSGEERSPQKRQKLEGGDSDDNKGQEVMDTEGSEETNTKPPRRKRKSFELCAPESPHLPVKKASSDQQPAEITSTSPEPSTSARETSTPQLGTVPEEIEAMVSKIMAASGGSARRKARKVEQIRAMLMASLQSSQESSQGDEDEEMEEPAATSKADDKRDESVAEDSTAQVSVNLSLEMPEVVDSVRTTPGTESRDLTSPGLFLLSRNTSQVSVPTTPDLTSHSVLQSSQEANDSDSGDEPEQAAGSSSLQTMDSFATASQVSVASDGLNLFLEPSQMLSSQEQEVPGQRSLEVRRSQGHVEEQQGEAETEAMSGEISVDEFQTAELVGQEDLVDNQDISEIIAQEEDEMNSSKNEETPENSTDAANRNMQQITGEAEEACNSDAGALDSAENKVEVVEKTTDNNSVASGSQDVPNNPEDDPESLQDIFQIATQPAHHYDYDDDDETQPIDLEVSDEESEDLLNSEKIKPQGRDDVEYMAETSGDETQPIDLGVTDDEDNKESLSQEKKTGVNIQGIYEMDTQYVEAPEENEEVKNCSVVDAREMGLDKGDVDSLEEEAMEETTPQPSSGPDASPNLDAQMNGNQEEEQHSEGFSMNDNTENISNDLDVDQKLGSCKDADSDAYCTADSDSIIADSQEESDRAVIAFGVAYKASSSPEYNSQYEEPLSPEIPLCASEGRAQTVSSADTSLTCEFDDDDQEDFSAPEVNLECLESQEVKVSSDTASVCTDFSPVRIIQPEVEVEAIDVSQEEDRNDVIEEGRDGHFRDSRSPTPTLTQSTPGSSKSSGRVGSILERIKAKKAIKRESLPLAEDRTPSPTTGHEEPGPSASRETGVCKRMSLRGAGNVTSDNINTHVNKCKDIVTQMSQVFAGQSQLLQLPRVKAWGKEIAQLKQKTSLPKTVIAVVGDTGAGKSSLMNAILDHAAILPTSGMRACTAVVVEISDNPHSNNYEADVDFLSEQEWYSELELLLTDLRGTDGQVKARAPDPQTEAGVAWSKIRAVYGPFKDGLTLAMLQRMRGVTHWLGKTKHIKNSSAQAFRREIDRYIESTDMGQGGDYWPIVKHVSVRIPNCFVLSSGATLVDLPGIRDSNAARDKIAREFLKQCSAVWVVASIHRAVDDRTAKELLGEHFRRQLLMDGQYGSISFICTKTDILVPSEIIRALNLGAECEPLENEIAALEGESLDNLRQIRELKRERKRLEEMEQELEVETREEQEDVTDLTQALDQDESVNEEGAEQLQQLEQVLQDKLSELEETRAQIRNKDSQGKDLEKQNMELESKISVRQKAIHALCSKARNQYSTQQIRRDFKAGLRVMKRQAGMVQGDDEDEEEEYSDEDDDGLDIAQAVENLNVFCVSSTEYLKLCNKLPKDGPPLVFSQAEDTGVPSLQQFVHRMTELRRLQSTEKLIRSVGRTVADIMAYLTDRGTKDSNVRNSARELFDQHLQALRDSEIPAILDRARQQMDVLFQDGLEPSVQEGSLLSAEAAPKTVTKWGSKVNKEKRELGGFPWPTYKATCRREGVYQSPTSGQIDFNEDLTAPFYSHITIVWNSVFNGQLQRLMEVCRSSIMLSLQQFGSAMQRDLQLLGMSSERVARVHQQHQASADHKLRDTISALNDLISERQREASRIVTPSIQVQMGNPYRHCAEETGPGQFMRMKHHMNQHVEQQRQSMFDTSSSLLLQQLVNLQAEVMTHLEGTCEGVLQDLAALYEPLWEAPMNTKLLRDHFLPGLLGVRQPVLDMYEAAQIDDNVQELQALKQPINPSPTYRPALSLSRMTHTATTAQCLSWNQPPETAPVTPNQVMLAKQAGNWGAVQGMSVLGEIRLKTETATMQGMTPNIPQMISSTTASSHLVTPKVENPLTVSGRDQQPTKLMSLTQKTMAILTPISQTAGASPSTSAVLHTVPKVEPQSSNSMGRNQATRFTTLTDCTNTSPSTSVQQASKFAKKNPSQAAASAVVGSAVRVKMEPGTQKRKMVSKNMLIDLTESTDSDSEDSLPSIKRKYHRL